MQHIYKNIPGWFNFEEYYALLVSRIPDNFVFVELGVWKGKSISYFAVETVNQNKSGTIYAVDHWLGSDEHQKGKSTYDPDIDIQDGVFNSYLSNIKPIEYLITNIRKPSVEASKIFTDSSIDAVFIDASHDYDNVSKDIDVWFPKVKDDGIICGHDYDSEPVKTAVKDAAIKYHRKIIEKGCVWEYSK